MRRRNVAGRFVCWLLDVGRGAKMIRMTMSSQAAAWDTRGIRGSAKGGRPHSTSFRPVLVGWLEGPTVQASARLRFFAARRRMALDQGGEPPRRPRWPLPWIVKNRGRKRRKVRGRVVGREALERRRSRGRSSAQDAVLIEPSPPQSRDHNFEGQGTYLAQLLHSSTPGPRCRDRWKP